MIGIRRERPEDIAPIRTVNEAAFEQTTEADIIDALRDVCPDVLSLVAESDGEIVGHILFSPVTIEDGSQSRQGMVLVLDASSMAGVSGVARYREEFDVAM